MGSPHVSHIEVEFGLPKTAHYYGKSFENNLNTRTFSNSFVCFLHRVNDPITTSLWFFLYIIVVRTTLGITQRNFLLDLVFTIYVCPHLIPFLKTHYSNPFPFDVSLKFAFISHRKLILISF